MSTLGFTLAVGSALANGSFAALSKMPRVLRAGTEPIVFNTYVCYGVFLSGLVVLPFMHLADQDIGFTGYGFLAGCLFVMATLFSFLAIPEVGLAIGQAVWSGSAVMVAFLWGSVGPEAVRKPTQSIGGSIGAVVCLLTGIFGIIYSQGLSTAGAAPASAPLLAGGKKGLAEGAEQETPRTGNRGLGLMYASLVGGFGGSILVPLSYVDDERLNKIGFLPSFGLGCFVLGTLVAVGKYGLIDKRMPALDITASLAPALASGLVWNLGNTASIYAMAGENGLSYGVAYPLMQCALFVSGLWGIFVFKEITRPLAIAVFFGFGAILLGGAVLLAVYGPKS